MVDRVRGEWCTGVGCSVPSWYGLLTDIKDAREPAAAGMEVVTMAAGAA